MVSYALPKGVRVYASTSPSLASSLPAHLHQNKGILNPFDSHISIILNLQLCSFDIRLQSTQGEGVIYSLVTPACPDSQGESRRANTRLSSAILPSYAGCSHRLNDSSTTFSSQLSTCARFFARHLPLVTCHCSTNFFPCHSYTYTSP